MRNNIKIRVSNPLDLRDMKEQVYTNYGGLTLEAILKDLSMGVVLPPEVGNFPPVGGHNKYVKITGVVDTFDEDNAGLDIANVIERYTGWGKPNG